MTNKKPKWTTLAAVVMGIAPLSSFALGLGGLDLRSHLNEPLQAYISLNGLGDIEPEEIRARVASQEAYERAGIEKTSALRDISFSVELDVNNNPFIRASSHEGIQDPFLDLMVEVMWPKGRVIRSYTLLLDLPTQAKGKKKSAAKNLAAAPLRIGNRVSAKQATVGQNDTLWHLAKDLVGNDPDRIRQAVMAIALKNPHAFSQQDINLLKKGTVLDLPTTGEINQFSQMDAKNFIAGKQSFATTSFQYETEGPEPVVGQSEPNVFQAKPLSQKPLTLTSATEEPLSEAIAKRLTSIEQSMASVKTSYEAVSDRISALEDQNKKIMALVNGDMSLAKIEITPPVADPLEDLPGDEAFELLGSSDSDLPTLVLDVPVVLPEQNAELATVEVEQPEAQLEKVQGVSVAPANTVLGDIMEAVDAPLAVELAPEEQSTSSSLWLWFVGLGALGLGGAWLMRARRMDLVALGFLDNLWLKFASNEQQADQQSEVNFSMPFDINKAINAVTEEESRFLANPKLVGETQDKQPDIPEPEHEKETIEDAKIFMAYERFSQAEGILKNILDNEPNWDAAIMLLELYVLTEQYHAFDSAYKMLPPDLQAHSPQLYDKAIALRNKVRQEQLGSIDSSLEEPVQSQSTVDPKEPIEDELLTSFETLGPNEFGKGGLSLEPIDTIELKETKDIDMSGHEQDDVSTSAEEEILEISLPEAPEERQQETETELTMSAREVEDILALIQAYIEIGEEAEVHALAEKVQQFGNGAQQMKLRDILNNRD